MKTNKAKMCAGVLAAACLACTGQASAFWTEGGQSGGAQEQLGISAEAGGQASNWVVPATDEEAWLDRRIEIGKEMRTPPQRVETFRAVPAEKGVYYGEEIRAFVCRNDKGEIGYNKVSVEELLAAKKGECADLYGADLKFANLRGADLRGAHLAEADLSFANLEGADLSGASLRSAKLETARLAHAKLYGAYMSNADMTGAILDGADMREAMLYLADFVRAKLYETRLHNADMQGADLMGAWMLGADLSGAKLKDAIYDDRTEFPILFNPLRKREMIRAEAGNPARVKAEEASVEMRRLVKAAAANGEILGFIKEVSIEKDLLGRLRLKLLAERPETKTKRDKFELAVDWQFTCDSSWRCDPAERPMMRFGVGYRIEYAAETR